MACINLVLHSLLDVLLLELQHSVVGLGQGQALGHFEVRLGRLDILLIEHFGEVNRFMKWLYCGVSILECLTVK